MRVQKRLRDQKGAVVLINAIALTILLGVVGLAVDVGHLYVVKSELQRAADAGALAGARAIFTNALSSKPLLETPQCATALEEGTRIAQANLADRAIPLVPVIQTGTWDWQANSFSQGCSSSSADHVNGVSITTRLESIPLSILGILGFGPVTVNASSLGVMDWVLLPGFPAIPVGVGKNWAEPNKDLKIYFDGENQDTGGWYTIPPANVDTTDLRSLILNPSTALLRVGDMVNVSTAVKEAALKEFDSFGGKVVLLPVIDTTSFKGNFNTVGFIAFQFDPYQPTGQDGGPGNEDKTGGKKFIKGKTVSFPAPNPSPDQFQITARLVQ